MSADADAATLRNAKASLIALVGLLTFAASLAPWYLQRVFRRSSLDVMNLLSALSAGIVFGAFMTHILPDSEDDFSAYLEAAFPPAEDGTRSDAAARLVAYPWAPLVAGLVTALLVAVDRTIVSHGVHGDDGEHDHHHHDHVSQAFVAMSARAEKAAALEGSPLVEALVKAEQGGTPYGLVASSVSSTAEAHGHSHGSHGHHGAAAAGVNTGAGEECPVVQKAAQRDAALRTWVFFVALSLHSVFDGLSLGGETSLSTFYGILVAVLAHKAFDGLALGVPVYLARLPPLQTWGSLIFCAAMTPLGIGIGWAATSYQGPNSKLASAIILGMSAGSFLFISLLELLPSALHDGRLVAGKLTAFVVGFVAMAALAAYV